MLRVDISFGSLFSAFFKLLLYYHCCFLIIIKRLLNIKIAFWQIKHIVLLTSAEEGVEKITMCVFVFCLYLVKMLPSIKPVEIHKFDSELFGSGPTAGDTCCDVVVFVVGVSNYGVP